MKDNLSWKQKMHAMRQKEIQNNARKRREKNEFIRKVQS